MGGSAIAPLALLAHALAHGAVIRPAALTVGAMLAAWAVVGDRPFAATGLSWVAVAVLLRRRGVGAAPAPGAVAVTSALAVVPTVLLFGRLGRIAALPPAGLLAQAVVPGLLSGVLAVVAPGWAVERLGPSRAAPFPAMVPAATLLVGRPVTGEVPSADEWLGAALATLGLGLAMGGLPARGRIGREAQR